MEGKKHNKTLGNPRDAMMSAGPGHKPPNPHPIPKSHPPRMRGTSRTREFGTWKLHSSPIPEAK